MSSGKCDIKYFIGNDALRIKFIQNKVITEKAPIKARTAEATPEMAEEVLLLPSLLVFHICSWVWESTAVAIIVLTRGLAVGNDP